MDGFITKEINDESGFRKTLKGIFNRFGWDAKSEITSDCSNYRTDLIVRHPKWGVVGIECKYTDEPRPRVWANALKQVQQYSGATFQSENIQRWAVAVGGRSHNEINYIEFMNAMGYGVLQSQDRIELVFNYSNPMVKFPVASINHSSGELTAPDLQRLQDCDTSGAHQYFP